VKVISAAVFVAYIAAAVVSAGDVSRRPRPFRDHDPGQRFTSETTKGTD
jgi:hypothetical protein